jgi:hypothetical protein
MVPIPRGKRIFKNSASPKLSSIKHNLVKLFELVYYKAYIVKKYNSNKNNSVNTYEVDTDCFWNPIQAKLNKKNNVHAKPHEWKLSLSGNEEEEIEHLDNNEKNNYLKKIVSIIKNKDPIISNIIEIALNMGLYKGYVEGTSNYIKKNINAKHENWYNPHYPFKSIDDFVDEKQIKTLSRFISDQDVHDIKGYLDVYPNPPETRHYTRRRIKRKSKSKSKSRSRSRSTSRSKTRKMRQREVAHNNVSL